MGLFNRPQRRILSKFQKVDRLASAPVMPRNLSPSANVSIVCSSSSDEDGRVLKSNMDEQPGRFVRQGTYPCKRSSLKKQGVGRSKSFRVSFAATTTANDGEFAAVVPPITPPKKTEQKFFLKYQNQTRPQCQKSPEPVKKSEPSSNTASQKIANRKKPVRRPTSHVPNSKLGDEDEVEVPKPAPVLVPVQIAGPSSSHRGGGGERRTSITQFLGQTVISPVEEKLRQLAIKYKKNKEESSKQRTLLPASSFKANRVSTLASKFEQQISGEK